MAKTRRPFWLPGIDVAARARRLRQYAARRRQRDSRQQEFLLDPTPADAGQVKAKKEAA